MILKRLTLSNVRSYRNPPPIEFTLGISLFEGDIGAGKSTILSAIEFALFGLGDQSGSHLLRVGEKSGSVLLEFDAEGKPYKAFRSLVRRRRSVVQDEGYIVEGDVRTHYKVTEMKNRILQILNFNESPNPRAQSVIYRYAVFTPQEAMKEVLIQKADQRLQTLRKAFRIEEYSRATQNASVLSSWIRGEARELKGRTSDLEEKREGMEQENKKLKQIYKDLSQIESSIKKIEKELNQMRKKTERLNKRKTKVETLRTTIPPLQEQIESAKQQLENVESRIKEFSEEFKNATKAEKTLKTLEPRYESYLKNKKELEELEKKVEKYRNLEKEESKLANSIETEKKLLEKNITNLQNQVERQKAEIEKVEKEIAGLPKLEKKLSKIEKELEQLDKITKEMLSIEKNLSVLKANIDNTTEERSRKKKEWETIENIGVNAPCPRCQQRLTKKHYEKVKAGYEQEIDNLEETLQKFKSSELRLPRELMKLEKKKGPLEKKQKDLEDLHKTVAALKEKRKNINNEKKELEANKQTLLKMTLRLKQGKYAEKERKNLQKTQQRMKKIESSRKRYDDLKIIIRDLEQEKIEAAYSENKTKAEQRPRIEKTLKDSKKEAKKLLEQIGKLNGELTNKQKEFEKNKRVIEELEELSKEIEKLEKTSNSCDREKAGKLRETELIEESIKKAEEEVKQKEREKLRQEFLEQIRIWLNDHFVPSLEVIEQHVLESIHHEFNALFQKWFETLVESEEISIRIDEEFTPFVEQNGYELDVNSLSGGEKTSVALAYRLALNTMVKRVCNAMRSNLLVLDEPTDGFSKEQLFKLRDILDELNCEQVIIVSHERELENFADNIYLVTKEGGVSQVQSQIAQ